MFKSIKNKIIIIISIYTLLFLVYLFIDKYGQNKDFDSLFKMRESEKSQLLDKIITLQGSSQEILTFDYTYWDELVNFVKTGDTTWANSQIAAGLPSYKTNFVWIYNLDNSLVYSYNTFNQDNYLNSPFTKAELEQIFSKNYFSHFFLKVDTNYIEIRTASIQPSNDKERKTPPRGYFITGRLWSKDLLKELSGLIEAKVSLIDDTNLNAANTKETDEDDIFLKRNFLTYDDKFLFQMDAFYDSDILIKSFLKFNNEKLAIVIIFSILSLIFQLVLLIKWVSNPLRKLAHSLSHETTENIEGLMKEKNEFGTIASMIETSFIQKRALKNEIEEHEKTFNSLRKSEENIKTSLKEKEVLLKEIHHRVKNNLQIISSLLKLQSRYLKDKKAIAIFRESQDRVKTMALIHERLYRTQNISKINYYDYVKALTSNLMISYGIRPDTIKLTYDIDDVVLDVDTAIPCSLIINELVSNCFKYAFNENAKGNVIVSMKYGDDKKYYLSVSDDGKGLPYNIDYKNTESLGLQLVNTLVEQLEAQISYKNSIGSKFTIVFDKPAESIAPKEN